MFYLVHDHQHGHQPVATRMRVQLPQRERVRNVLRRLCTVTRHRRQTGRIEQHLKDGRQHAPAHVMVLIKHLLQVGQKHVEYSRCSETKKTEIQFHVHVEWPNNGAHLNWLDDTWKFFSM